MPAIIDIIFDYTYIWSNNWTPGGNVGANKNHAFI